MDQCNSCDLQKHVGDVAMGSSQWFYWCSKGNHDWHQGVAIINFPWSLMESISIETFRNDSIPEVLQPSSPSVDDLQPTVVVEICDRKAGCTLCNSLIPELRINNNAVKCVQGAMEGNQIRILHPGKPINICQIKLYGRSKNKTPAKNRDIFRPFRLQQLSHGIFGRRNRI